MPEGGLPYRPDILEGWRMALSKTLITLVTLKSVLYSQLGRDFLQMLQYIISYFGCLWCWKLLYLSAQRFFLPEDLCRLLKRLMFCSSLELTRGLYRGFNFQATPFGLQFLGSRAKKEVDVIGLCTDSSCGSIVANAPRHRSFTWYLKLFHYGFHPGRHGSHIFFSLINFLL